MSNNPQRTPLGYRAEQMKLRRVSLTPAPVESYDHGGRVFAEFSAVSLWGTLWGFNGACTAVALAAFSQWLAQKIWGVAPFWTSYFLTIPVGIIGHLVISSIEQHLWREGRAPEGTIRERLTAMQSVRTAEAVIVGSIDSLTTSSTLLALALFFGAKRSLPTIVWSTLFGTLLALVAEPMLRYHYQRLRTLLKQQRRRE